MPLDQRALAELGARSEVTRLTTELVIILSEFPRLAVSAYGDITAQLAPLSRRPGRPPRPTPPTPPLNGHAKRGTMSAKARKEMSARMRKRWRAAKKAGKSTLQKAAEARK